MSVEKMLDAVVEKGKECEEIGSLLTVAEEPVPQQEEPLEDGVSGLNASVGVSDENRGEEKTSAAVLSVPEVSSEPSGEGGGDVPSSGEVAEEEPPVDDISFCTGKDPEAWKNLAKFLKREDLMGGMERSQSFMMGKTLDEGKKTPSAALSRACRKIWMKAADKYGWQG